MSLEWTQQHIIIPELHNRQPRELFQLDGAPPHWFYGLGRLLMTNFQTVGLGETARRSDRSPDLTPLDFFLLSYVKTKVFKSEIKDFDYLKTKINEAVASVYEEMLVKTWKEVKSRLKMLAENGGRHVKG